MYKYTTRALVKDMWGYIRPYKGRFIFGSVSRVISDLSWLYPAYALAEIITFLTNYKVGQSFHPLYVIFLYSTIVVVIYHVCMYIAKQHCFAVAEKIALDSQYLAIQHMFKLDIAWHERENAGNKLKKITRGGDGLIKIIRIWISNYIEIVINFVAMIIIIARFDLFLAGTVIFFILSFYALSISFRRRAVSYYKIVNTQEEDMHGLLFEVINNIRSVKVMSMTEAIITLLVKASRDLYGNIVKRIFWFQFGGYFRTAYGQLYRLVLMGIIIYGIIHGRYEIGFLLLFTGYFGSIWKSVTELTDVADDFSVAKNGVYRMQGIFKESITIDSEAGKVDFPQQWEKISISNLSFSYGGRNVLEDVSFEIKRGEKIGIVGLSGAGKSTLFKLLLKEYENYTGGISFDDVSLKTISKKDYFNHIAVVLQETELFNMSLKENIVITNSTEKDNEELLNKSISIAHVEDFMNKLPNGVSSVVGEKGVKLSGGEKQRVGMARAVFKNPQILLLDEATSHLDVESEEKIQDSLHQFFQSVTAVVIAHRLSTIKEMDRIIVLEGGKILEHGSFNELYGRKGRFYELWEKQKL